MVSKPCANGNASAVSWDADEYQRTVMAFRNAVIGSREVSLWVNRVISDVGSDFRFTPVSDRIAVLRQPTRGVEKTYGPLSSTAVAGVI
jgi:hypothetical protein